MKNLLPTLYKEYGQYSNYRNFPLDIDGLKPVERRVLLASYKIARNKLAISRKVDSYTTGNYHPHGECITGDTKILLLSGKKVKVKNLLGKKSFWVYSCTKNGVIKPGLAHSARIVKKVSKIYRIYIDNGAYFDCTEDHLIMLRNGEFIEAKNLQKNTSLMPLNLRIEDGYTIYKDNSRTICREEKVSWMVIRELINKDIDNLIGFQKYHSHHKNGIRNDDTPDNLDLLYYKDHCSETAKNRSDESNKIIGIKVKEAYNLNKNNFRENALKGLEKGRERMFSENSPLREKIREKNSELMTTYNKRYVEDRILKILSRMLSDNSEINKDSYEKYRTEIYNGPLWKIIFKKFNTIENTINIAKDYNHKVKKIEVINTEKEIEVYDISVEKYHNFAIDGGIFVHNCYGTIVQLVKQGFLVGQGNFGSSVGVESTGLSTGPAAPRYTQCRLKERTLELAFKYVKYVDWVDTELDDVEPVFLPVMYPICLMGTEPTQGIGFGYKTYIPCFNPQDLYKRLLWLLGIRKQKPTIAPITDCTITSGKKDLETLLTTGKVKLNVEGRIDIDNRTNTVTLRSWPPGKRFESFLNKFSKELSEGLVGYRDASVTETEIIFQVLRERNRDKIFNEFVEKLREVTKGIVSFETVTVDLDRKVVHRPIDEMLLNTFNMFNSVNLRMLSEERSRLQSNIEEYIALGIIRPVLSDCIKKGYDTPSTLNEIEKLTVVKREVADELIKKHRIAKLLTLSVDTTDLNNQLKAVENNLKKSKDFVLDQYTKFQ